MSLRVNFTDVSDRGPAKPDGWYKVRVSGGEVKTTGENAKTPGQEYMNVEFTVATPVEFAGQKFFTNLLLLNEKALPIVKGFMRATGRFTQEQLDGIIEFDSWEEFYQQIEGCELMVKNKQRPYNGDMTDNVNGYKALEGAVNTAKPSMLP